MYAQINVFKNLIFYFTFNILLLSLWSQNEDFWKLTIVKSHKFYSILVATSHLLSKASQGKSKISQQPSWASTFSHFSELLFKSLWWISAIDNCHFNWPWIRQMICTYSMCIYSMSTFSGVFSGIFCPNGKAVQQRRNCCNIMWGIL